MKLFAQRQFTIVRQIADHTDETTYYVRAIIRNAYTDTVLDTLDLTSRGSQRYSKNWQVPADPSGEGFYISIVTSVYTDSGYTTKSSLYGDQEQTYLVETREVSRVGGGSGLARRDIRDILQDELAKLKEELKPKDPEPIEFPPIPQYDANFKQLIAAIKRLESVLRPIPAKPIDFTPILNAVSEAKKAVQDKEVTEKTDLSPVVSEIKSQFNAIIGVLENIGDILIKRAAESIDEAIKNVQWESTFKTSVKNGEVPVAQEKVAKEEEPVPFDISKLSD